MMNGSLSENGKHPVGRSTIGQWGKWQCSISASQLTQRIWCGRRNVSPFERPSGHRQSIIRRQVLVNIIQSLSSSTQETATKAKFVRPSISHSRAHSSHAPSGPTSFPPIQTNTDSSASSTLSLHPWQRSSTWTSGTVVVARSIPRDLERRERHGRVVRWRGGR